MTLHLKLGVIDVPYKDAPRARRKRSAGTTTTGDVAEILEAKYDVMGTFFRLHEEEITEEVGKALGKALESILMGAPANRDPFARVGAVIETAFRNFLTNQEMDGVVSGVPTEAAIRGVSHRFKHPYARRDPRPSFIDTGLYEASFKAVLE